jgi:hypothetical protein
MSHIYEQGSSCGGDIVRAGGDDYELSLTKMKEWKTGGCRVHL